MYDKLLQWGDDLAGGFAQGREAKVSFGDSTPLSIAFVGMGGSGIAGRIITLLARTMVQLPMTIIDGPTVPAHFQASTLALVTSYSGDTWETLRAYDALSARGVRMVVVTSGGLLLQRAQADDVPYLLMPKGDVPRATLARMLGIQLALLERAGVWQTAAFVAHLAAHWEQVKGQVSERATYAGFLAHSGESQVMHVWGVTGDSDAAAYRLQTQLNENSKVAAVMSSFPELNHNLLVGFDAGHGAAPIVLLMSDFADDMLKTSAQCVREICIKRGISLYKPTLLGDTWVSQLAYSLWWADFASYYLGCERGYEIEQTRFIDNVKETFSRKVQEL